MLYFLAKEIIYYMIILTTPMRNSLLKTSCVVIFKHNQVHLQNDGKYILKYFLFYNENNHYTKIKIYNFFKL